MSGKDETLECSALGNEPLAAAMEKNVQKVKETLGESTDLVVRELWVGGRSELKTAILYIEGLADTTAVQDFIVRAVTSSEIISEEQERSPEADWFTIFKQYAVSVSHLEEVADFRKLFSCLMSGETIILLDRCDRGLAADTAGWEDRGVHTPEDQTVVRGPRDAFTENLRTNTALVRRKIKNPKLWLQSKTIGTLSQTSVAVMYIKGTADEQVVKEVHRRLDKLELAGILESGMIEELIEDRTYTPFPTMYNTERPDVVASGLMEGRVAILVDGTPFVLLVPALFIQYFQASEDYYQRSDFGLIRMLRMLAFFIALLGPSLYIAVTTFHQEMLPTPLMISIAAGREGIPFPAFVEALIMETIFEILREAGVRMPRAIGQAVSIVGALVIGQAAVEAGLVSPGMVIVVAITAISNFSIPAYSMGIAVRILRYPLMGMAAMAGLYGIFIGLGMIMVHLCSLRSFGVPYMTPFSPFNLRDQQDSLFRLPKVSLAQRIHPINTKKKRDGGR
ncbi:spore germination protein [Paenibacillus dendritiformis]|uniref:spore germination protein n=1 Tax=Paenibacillus dendritiformis TaxID=130049 RepID=UPI00143CFD5D|nr:spore germination protein [Paenibacillus dendritiformis]NKI20914.1 spore germination protein [Paenibacillus dendritiformis]NRG01139.1 spore germination protein [Paenibacillus dendritiformis]